MNGHIILPIGIQICFQSIGNVLPTLWHPDQVRRSSRSNNTKLFSRWFESLRGGKYVVVVVVRFC